MNKQRRKEVKRIVTCLKTLKGDINSVIDDEQFAFDNLPEGFQCSMRGSVMEDAVSDMCDVVDRLDEAIDTLEGVII